MNRFGLLFGGLLACLGTGQLLAQKCTSPDFKVELMYRAPDIEHPSVVACDDDGNLYVGEDPMDMRGPTTKHFDRIVLLRRDAKTGTLLRTVFAENLAAVFGIIPRDGAVYVMHAPLYSVFRDTNGDGVADERKDLAQGFGPAAGVFGFNDHIVTGIRLGIDNKVYISVGDKGIPKATGADGSTLTLEGGGVVRMNLDGTELEIVSSGTRNHLDVAMDPLDNIFTYDNTDDGLGWWTRFTHHIPAGYYGYPYDYHPHPERHLPRMSEHGGGSPVGAACYNEAAWPEKYRGAAFHCEWGKQKVQVFYLKRNGATFTNEMEDFLVKDGQEEFRPQDVCFSPDGSAMYVADWNFGGWVKPTLCGRLFKVTYTGPAVAAEPQRAGTDANMERLIASLGHPAQSERLRAQHRLAQLGKEALPALEAVVKSKSSPKFARIHAIWSLNEMLPALGPDASATWSLVLTNDKDPDVRAQAARAIGLRRLGKQLDALYAGLIDPDATVRLQAAIALGRIGSTVDTEELFRSLEEKDEFVRFAIVQALRAIGNWKYAPDYLKSKSPAIREGVLLALTGQYSDDAIAALAHCIEQGDDPALRARAVAALAEVHRQADPYSSGWWGTQPARGKPARSKIHAWSGTEPVLAALRSAARSKEPLVRRAAIASLSELKDETSLALFTEIVLQAQDDEEIRLAALAGLQAVKPAAAGDAAVKLLGDMNSPAGLAVAAMDVVMKSGAQAGLPGIVARLEATNPEVRAKSIDSYVRLAGKEATPKLIKFLGDSDAGVRQAAIRVAAERKMTEVIPALLESASRPDDFTESTLALAAMPDIRSLGVYLQGLASKNQVLRETCRAALIAIRDKAGAEIRQRYAANELSPELRRELQTVFAAPNPILKWQLVGAWPKQDELPKMDFTKAPDLKEKFRVGDREITWREIVTKDPLGKVSPGKYVQPGSDVWCVAYAAIRVEKEQQVRFVLGSDDQTRLYLNGELVSRFDGNRGWSPNGSEGTAKLIAGENHIYFLCGNDTGPWDFSLALRTETPEFAFLFENVPPQLDISAFRDFAMKNAGNAERGKKLFYDAKGIGCVKCHAVAGEGAKIGPDLIGIGAKYPREELIRSILEPSSRVAESFQVTTIVDADGRILSGIIKSENEKEVEILDAAGKVTVLATKDIDERIRSTTSLMPNGLKDGMSLADFADIVAYLESLKQTK